MTKLSKLYNQLHILLPNENILDGLEDLLNLIDSIEEHGINPTVISYMKHCGLSDIVSTNIAIEDMSDTTTKRSVLSKLRRMVSDTISKITGTSQEITKISSEIHKHLDSAKSDIKYLKNEMIDECDRARAEWSDSKLTNHFKTLIALDLSQFEERNDNLFSVPNAHKIITYLKTAPVRVKALYADKSTKSATDLEREYNPESYQPSGKFKTFSQAGMTSTSTVVKLIESFQTLIPLYEPLIMTAMKELEDGFSTVSQSRSDEGDRAALTKLRQLITKFNVATRIIDDIPDSIHIYMYHLGFLQYLAKHIKDGEFVG